MELVLPGLSLLEREIETERERQKAVRSVFAIVDVFCLCCGSARGFGLGARMDAEAWRQEL